MEAGVWQLITGRQDRLEQRIEDVEEKVEGVPELRKSVDRLTVAVYSSGVMFVGSAIAVVLRVG